jgi:hypothetical protein
MTKPEDILKFIDRTGYERACVEVGAQPMSDLDASALAETGYERLHASATEGASLAERAILATHLRRGWSVLSGRPESYSGGVL